MEDLKRVKIIFRPWFQAPPMPVRRYLEENGSADMLAAKRSAGFAPEVKVRVYVTHTTQSANKVFPFWLSTEVQNRPSSKFFLKIIFTWFFTVTTLVITL